MQNPLYRIRTKSRYSRLEHKLGPSIYLCSHLL